MKAKYTIILVLVIATAGLFGIATPCKAMGATQESNQPESKPGWRPAEAIEHTMVRLRENEPEKAKQLEKLREENPEKFRAELRKIMGERLAKKRSEHMKRGKRKAERMCRPERDVSARGKDRGIRGRERFAGHLKWLEKNYPQQAEKLAQLKEKKSELYGKHMGHSLKKYGRILEAETENPKLAKALREDLELRQNRDKLLKKIKAVIDDNEKEKLVEKLKEVIGKRFDLIVKRKQMEYEQLRRKLEKLERSVRRSEAEVGKWKDVEFKNENIKTRLEELVGEAEKFKWD